VVQHSVAATYPPAALAARLEAHVDLGVTVEVDGSAGNVEVLLSGGAEFDAAAVEAMRQWRFSPATRDGQPVAARIRVPFDFVLPAAEPVAVPNEEHPEHGSTPQDASTTPAPEPDTDPVAASTTPTAEEEVIDVTVRGERELRTEGRSASDFELQRDQLAAAPRSEGAEVLRSAPGLYIGRSEGPAVAHNYMLRGFDAEHGQDIAFRVGGLPINLPSHIHGQGYADLGFLIADVVSGMNVRAGVSDPSQGDFAVAGSIDISLGVAEDERGVRLATSYGSFRTSRQLLLFAPRGLAEETFGAVQYTRTDGFGENRAGQAASAILQRAAEVGDFTLRAIGVLHTARSDLAGVLRRDDIDAGRVCFSCVYDLPTAQAQNALEQPRDAGPVRGLPRRARRQRPAGRVAGLRPVPHPGELHRLHPALAHARARGRARRPHRAAEPHALGGPLGPLPHGAHAAHRVDCTARSSWASRGAWTALSRRRTCWTPRCATRPGTSAWTRACAAWTSASGRTSTSTSPSTWTCARACGAPCCRTRSRTASGTSRPSCGPTTPTSWASGAARSAPRSGPGRARA
jgi:TonB family protein